MTQEHEVRSVWWELSAGGPCMLLKRLIDRHNETQFDPFSWLSVCYCSPEFDRSDVIAPHVRPDRETLNYLVTGLVDPPDLSDERLSEVTASHWINMVGGLKQAARSESVYVLNMELWMRVLLGGGNGGGKRWEFESEYVPLVRTDGAEVRVVCGQFQHREGAVAQHPLGTTIFDVTLSPGGSFEFSVPEENTTFAYMFGGKAQFGKDGDTYYGADSLLRVRGGEIFASTLSTGGRFLLFSACPVVRKGPALCPDKTSDVCQVKK